MLALDYCHQKAAESHSSFLSGFRFLSVEKRNAITVLYAFCRELDDVVDGCTDPNVAQITLNWWRSDLEKVFNSSSLFIKPFSAKTAYNASTECPLLIMK